MTTVKLAADLASDRAWIGPQLNCVQSLKSIIFVILIIAGARFLAIFALRLEIYETCIAYLFIA